MKGVFNFNSKGLAFGVGAFLLEATGVTSGAYTYGAFPFKFCGVPLIIPLMWLTVAYLAYILYETYGTKGILLTYSLDLLILEPLAFKYNLWKWTNPYTLLFEPFGTVANCLVWIGMLGLGVLLFKRRDRND